MTARDIPVIEGTALAKTFRLRGRMVRAVQGVSLAVRAGEALGIVGEFGLRQDHHRAIFCSVSRSRAAGASASWATT